MPGEPWRPPKHSRRQGGIDDALALLSSAEAGPLDMLQRAEGDALRARIAFAADRGSEAPALLLAAARRLHDLDASLARDLYLDALTAALFAGRMGGPCNARAIAAIARGAPHIAAPRAQDLLLDGLTSLIADGAAG